MAQNQMFSTPWQILHDWIYQFWTSLQNILAQAILAQSRPPSALQTWQATGWSEIASGPNQVTRNTNSLKCSFLSNWFKMCRQGQLPQTVFVFGFFSNAMEDAVCFQVALPVDIHWWIQDRLDTCQNGCWLQLLINKIL